MQFSIDDLPAPLGPMMARISPLAMSKLMSLSAFTPPNDRLMFSTASRTSLKERVRLVIGSTHALPDREPPARSWGGGGPGARGPEDEDAASARLPERHRARARMRREIADLDVAFDGALAAVLEG